MSKLNIFEEVVFDDVIIKEEFHTYQPLNNSYDNNDEVRFVIHNQRHRLRVLSMSREKCARHRQVSSLPTIL